ncbi:hypothetical protein B4U80_12528, partial [Leptotrombidium deliense]
MSRFYDGKVWLREPIIEGNYKITATISFMALSNTAHIYVTVLKAPKLGIVGRGECTVGTEIFYKTCNARNKVAYTFGNNTITFVCVIPRNIEVDVQWLKNGKFLKNGEVALHPHNNALIVTKLIINPNSADDIIYGNYACRLNSDVGSLNSTVKLMKLHVPNAPTNYTYEAYGESVKLKIIVEEQKHLMIKYLSYRFGETEFITVPVNLAMENKQLVVIAFINNLT